MYEVSRPSLCGRRSTRANGLFRRMTKPHYSYELPLLSDRRCCNPYRRRYHIYAPLRLSLCDRRSIHANASRNSYTIPYRSYDLFLLSCRNRYRSCRRRCHICVPPCLLLHHSLHIYANDLSHRSTILSNSCAEPFRLIQMFPFPFRRRCRSNSKRLSLCRLRRT